MDPFSDPDFIRDEREANSFDDRDRMTLAADAPTGHVALFVPVTLAGNRHYLLTAAGLDRLGHHDLAAEARKSARARLEARGLIDDDDAPAGAGDDVEAFRG